MSQTVRENSKCGEVVIVVDPPSGDERGDSDPPIENDNPEEETTKGQEKGKGEQKQRNGERNDPEKMKRKEMFEQAKKRAQQDKRKRKKSGHVVDANYVPPYKKNRFRHLPSVLPSKFLLGGNIRDPLNLASLADARVSAELNKVTPQSSPLPVQGEVPVFIPKNPHDPLGLTTKTPENVEDIVAGVRKYSYSRKHRHRKRAGRKRTDSECSVATEGDEAHTKELANEGGVDVEKQEVVDTGGKTEGHVKQAIEPKENEEKSSGTYEPREPDDEKLEEDKGSGEKGECSNVAPHCGTNVSSAPTTTAPNQEPDKSAGGFHDCQDYYYPPSNEYNPLVRSDYSPSPFIYDGGSSSSEYYPEVPPYESPFAHFPYTPSYHMQPFSPPPMPEIPPFQRRMQIYSQRPQHLSLQRAVFRRPFTKKRWKHNGDPIVSPVVPQPGTRRRPHPHSHHNQGNHRKLNEKPNGEPSSTKPKQLQQQRTGDSVRAGGSNTNPIIERDKERATVKGQVFQFGNYSHYYGYRTAEEGDPRLWVLKKEYFQNKEVLDIGCNSGHVTLSIARDFEPRRIHGIDIDYSLISVARKSIKHYVVRDPEDKNIVFPRSLPLIYGAMQPPRAPGEERLTGFPHNVSFAHENYVLSSDQLLDNVKPQYDVIVCFSVTKWIHLNYGDEGMKRFFNRIFRHLREDGILVLEPQPWTSYLKKKKVTENIHRVFQSIKFYPDQFEEYLLNDVGFGSCESLGTPIHHSKGFQRPILVFRKPKKTVKQEDSSGAAHSSSSVSSSDLHVPQANATVMSQSRDANQVAVSSSTALR